MINGDATLRCTSVHGCKFVARKFHKEFSDGHKAARRFAYESDKRRTILDKK